MLNKESICCPKCDRYCFYVLDLNKYKCACGASWNLKDVDHNSKKRVWDYG
ncbi:MAG: hypothetical protein ACRC8P_01515 [Spiroplasma sp.]